MSKGKGPTILVVIAFAVGIALALVIITGAIVFIKMNRHATEPPGLEPALERTTEKSPKETRRAPREEDEEEARWSEELLAEAEAEAAATAAAAVEDQPRKPSGYAIAGQVVDESGAAVADAEVEVRRELSYATWDFPAVKKVTTDEQGKFQADDLPSRHLFLTAAKGEQRFYIPSFEAEPWIAWFYPVRYVPGRNLVTGIHLVLRPGAVLAGKVVDVEDQPVTNAVVTVHQYPALRLELAVDKQGAFRASGLVPGEYELSAKADGFLPLALSERIPSGRDDVLLRLERGCPIEGSVIFADSGEAVPEAKVVARAEGADAWGPRTIEANTATTDAEGRFQMLIRLNEETRLSASWEEYISEEEQTMCVAEGDLPSPVIFELIKGGSVSGTVREEGTEEPVEGVELITHLRAPRLITAQSDIEGRFILKGLEPGRRRILIRPNEYKATERSVPVEVVQGEETSGVEVWVTKKVEVTGTVIDEEAKPIFGARVVPREDFGDPRRRTRTGEATTSDCDGNFVLKESYGKITGLLVTHPQYTHKFVDLEQDEEASGTKDIRIVLDEKGGSIAGLVRDESDQPKQHIVVSLAAVEADIPIQRRGITLKTAVTDNSGHYLLAGVAAGTYRVKARVSGQEVFSGEVHIAKEQVLTDVNLVVPSSGHIAGRVTDPEGAPVAGATVRPQRLSSHWGRSPYGRTDSEGNYRIENLEEGGEYFVRTSARGYRGHSGRSKRRRVTCSADGVDFVLTPVSDETETGTVSGFVYRQSDGSPVTSFRLVITGGGRRRPRWEDVTSPDGSFRCEDVLVGRRTIIIGAAGFREFQSEPFEVKAGEETVQTLYLDEGGTILGVVRRESDRSPVTEFTFSLVPKENPSEGKEGRHRSTPYRNRKHKSDDGSFRCDNIETGQYTIYIASEGLPDFETEPFKVASNAETTLDISIGEGASIRGRVVDEFDRPVPEAVVEESSTLTSRRQESGIRDRNSRTPEPRKKTSSDEAGRFVLAGLTPGKVTLKVTHPDYSDLEVPDIPVSKEAPVEDLVLRLERGTLVYGWVKDLDGKLTSNVSVGLRGGGRQFSGRTDYRGEFRIEHVPNGTYESWVTYLNAALPRITIESDEERELNVDFTEAGTITGSLEVPWEAEGLTFQIEVRGLDKMTDRYRAVTPENDNSFKIEGVFAGKYRLVPTVRSTGDRRRPLTVTTNPQEITVTVRPRQETTEVIRVTKIAERD